MIVPRGFTTATVLDNGTVLFVGGPVFTSTSELYTAEGISLAPQSLQVSPSQATLLVGGVRDFSVDQTGRPRSDATWSISDPSLATVESVAGVARVEAVAPGSVTVTAEIQGVQASATFVIAAGSSLPRGSPLWALAPSTSGVSLQQIIQSPTRLGPSPYVVESKFGERCLSRFGARRPAAMVGGGAGCQRSFRPGRLRRTGRDGIHSGQGSREPCCPSGHASS
jgi:hypothetical protein